MKREGRAVVEKRALVDDDVSAVKIHQRISRRLVRSGDVTLGFEIEIDLMGQRARWMWKGIPRQLPAIGRCKWPMNM